MRNGKGFSQVYDGCNDKCVRCVWREEHILGGVHSELRGQEENIGMYRSVLGIGV